MTEPKPVVHRATELIRQAMAKVFPAHWSFLLGELAMFSFVVLVLSGLYLNLFYDASSETVTYQGSYEALQGVEVSRAYSSVLDITFDRPAGAIVRQTHHWASLVFVGSIILHAMRVFFTGAFRRPRRLNWAVGVTMMGLAMGAGFFGLALPHDVLGGTGSRIGHAFAVSIPLIGPGLADLVFGGEFAGEGMLYRFWQIHVIALPLLIAGLLGVHLTLVWLQTHTHYRRDTGRADAESDRSATSDHGETPDPTQRPDDDKAPGADDPEGTVVGAAAWPGYALKTVGLFAIVAGVIVGLGSVFQIGPIWLYGPFDPAAATVPAQPDWYLGWVEGILRIAPSLEIQMFGYEIPSPFLTGLLFPVLVFVVLYAWPFAEAAVTGDRRPHHGLDRPRDRPVRTSLGVAGLALLGVLLLAGSHDLQGLLLGVSVDDMTVAYRLLVVMVPLAAGIVTYSVCTALIRTEDEGSGRPGIGPWQPDDVPRADVPSGSDVAAQPAGAER